MSSASVEQLKEKLLSCLDEERNVTDMAGALDVVTNLQTVTITREVLEATRMGLLVNDIRRKNQDINPQLGKLCRGLIKDWQKLVSESSTQSTGGGKFGISPALERTTPSGRTSTPQKAVAAKLIAESGLRCSPSPALTPRVQQPGPAMVNGSAQLPRSAITGAEASPSFSSQRGPTPTSSYAPPEQQQSNGHSQAGLKIRIKYGSADQQTSIVREIEQQSQGPSDAAAARRGAEEVANRRKRKVSNDHASRTTLGLVNGGSKSVSPYTPLPSPSPSVVDNAVSPTAVQAGDAGAGAAAATKLAKKSKSSSPAPVPSPAASVTNILQRPKLKSTAELVAEMTSSYPETMSISLKNVAPTPVSPPFGATGASGSTTIMASVLAAEGATLSDGSDIGDDDSRDEDYHEPGSKRKAKVTWTATFVNDRSRADVNKAELIDRYLRDHSSRGIEPAKRVTANEKRANAAVDGSKLVRGESGTVAARDPIDWYASVQLPPIDVSVLDSLFDVDEAEDEPDGDGDGKEICDTKLDEGVNSDSATNVGKLLDSCIPADDDLQASSLSSAEEVTTNGVQWRSRLLKETPRGDRQVLAMPYVDIGLPDFLEYGYANRQQYLAHWSER